MCINKLHYQAIFSLLISFWLFLQEKTQDYESVARVLKATVVLLH